MALRAVFFDMYQTVVYLHPEREQRLAAVLEELGIAVLERDLAMGYAEADRHYTLAGMETPIHLLNRRQKDRLYVGYYRTVLEGAGLGKLAPSARRIRDKYWGIERTLRPFPDVVATLAWLKEAGYLLGMITNVDSDPKPDLEQAGILRWFDGVTASCQVGCEKPHAEIFQAALDALGVAPEEAVHVGDQLLADVEGATGAGIRGILLDRHGIHDGKCPDTIRSLEELPGLLDAGRRGTRPRATDGGAAVPHGERS